MKNTIVAVMGLMLGLGNLQAAKLVTDNLPGLPGQSDAYWAERRQEQAEPQKGQGQFVNLREVAVKQELAVNREDKPVCFYTGKPFDVELGTYVFKYRNYNPEMQCWTTMDPSGFPDGANNYCYTSKLLITLDNNDLKVVNVLRIEVTPTTITVSNAMLAAGGVVVVLTDGVLLPVALAAITALSSADFQTGNTSVSYITG
jgi:RHS repeat-associated protein